VRADAADVTIRVFADDHRVPELTALLHRAYAPLAARGLRFVATHQDDATTRRRIAAGECLVAERGGRLVGTITWYSGRNGSACRWYRRDDVAGFGQFGVEPDLKGQGIGRALLDEVERRAAAARFAEIACDTAAPAAELIAMYARHGYREVERVQWDETNYESVILSKTL
jgi:GNAT superfamily N-acetyltransferase